MDLRFLKEHPPPFARSHRAMTFHLVQDVELEGEDPLKKGFLLPPRFLPVTVNGPDAGADCVPEGFPKVGETLETQFHGEPDDGGGTDLRRFRQLDGVQEGGLFRILVNKTGQDHLLSGQVT